MDPLVINAIYVIAGALAGYGAKVWQDNRQKIAGSLHHEVDDLMDDLEDLTGVDIPDDVREVVDSIVDEAIGEAEELVTDVISDLREGGNLRDALHASLSDEIAALKGQIDKLDELTVSDLKVALKTLELSVSGDKAKLVARLGDALSGME